MNLSAVLSAGTNGNAGAGGGAFILIFYVAVFILMIYFLMIKPQKKQAQKQQEMMKTLKPGCSIMTTSGFFGTVIDVPDDETVIVEFGNNKNCRIPMHQKAIAEIEDPNTVTVNGNEDAEEKKEDKKDDKKSKK